MAQVSKLISGYGPQWTLGIISEHLYKVEAHHDDEGWFVVDEHGDRYPVLCSELIKIHTEDGPIEGRCGIEVDADGYACELHHSVIDGYFFGEGR